MRFLKDHEGLGVISVLLVIFLFAMSTSGETGLLNKSPMYETARYKLTHRTSSLLQRRDVPEVFLDPYSVLGVLSFGVYIFYILYSRYQMGAGNHSAPGGNTHHPFPGGGGGGGGNNPGGNMYNEASQQNLVQLLDYASKILVKAAAVGGNNSTLLDTLDYEELTEDMPSS